MFLHSNFQTMFFVHLTLFAMASFVFNNTARSSAETLVPVSLFCQRYALLTKKKVQHFIGVAEKKSCIKLE